MIKQQTIHSNTGDAIRTWSDLDVYIINQFGEKFDIAYDDISLSAQLHYEETDEPIEDDILIEDDELYNEETEI